MSAKNATTSWIAIAMLVGGFCAGACAAPVAEEDAPEADEGQLRQGETEAAVLADRVASTDPKRSGVDYWRVRLVSSKSDGYFIVITGLRGGSELIDLVVPKDKDFYIRSADQSVALELSPDRAKALGADFQRIAEGLKGTSASGGGVATQSIGPRGGSVGGCVGNTAGAAIAAVGTVLFGAVATIFCAPGAVIIGSVELAAAGTLGEPGRFCKALYEPSVAAGKSTWRRMTNIPETCGGLPTAR